MAWEWILGWFSPGRSHGHSQESRSRRERSKRRGEGSQSRRERGRSRRTDGGQDPYRRRRRRGSHDQERGYSSRGHGGYPLGRYPPAENTNERHHERPRRQLPATSHSNHRNHARREARRTRRHIDSSRRSGEHDGHRQRQTETRDCFLAYRSESGSNSYGSRHRNSRRRWRRRFSSAGRAEAEYSAFRPLTETHRKAACWWEDITPGDEEELIRLTGGLRVSTLESPRTWRPRHRTPTSPPPLFDRFKIVVPENALDDWTLEFTCGENRSNTIPYYLKWIPETKTARCGAASWPPRGQWKQMREPPILMARVIKVWELKFGRHKYHDESLCRKIFRDAWQRWELLGEWPWKVGELV